MGFGQAISAGFSNYVNFSSRACRSEYWYWVLFIVLADIVAGIIDYVLGMQIVSSLFGLVTLLPGIAVSIRRLHDLDRTGWWILLGLIPIIGWITFDLVHQQGHRRTEPVRTGPARDLGNTGHAARRLIPALVIARSNSDEAIQLSPSRWIASRSLSSGRPLWAGPVGSQ
jgi:uncharacterized membrane protein YhaH (DUF805 family)